MSDMNSTPSAKRIHIGFFGMRNAGKSTLVNAVAGQELSVVSEIKGTTTDPVRKAMELLPLGSVVIIDTPGFDDEGTLGELRVKRTLKVLSECDIAVLVAEAETGLTVADNELLTLFKKRDLPYVIAYNKSDCKTWIDCTNLPSVQGQIYYQTTNEISVSALHGTNIHELKELIGNLVKADDGKLRLVGDLLKPADISVLVVPIDKAAPRGRLILPQQQTIRDVLEADAMCVVTKEYELRETLSSLAKKPAIVITDSQVFAKVAADTPQDVPLTSFSILFARQKGLLFDSVQGARSIDSLKDGDKILISEGCTHHRQCDDIGTVKIPRWLREYTKKDLEFHFTSGGDFPENLSEYSLVVHCGGCMLTDRIVKNRLNCVKDAGVKITNYGVLIAYMQGILERSIKVFGL
jgi:[FeFe] hydrogenase H-cluster maturation GTPase HydF